MAPASKPSGPVADLIVALQAAGDRAVIAGESVETPAGLSARRLAALQLPNGAPVGGSLAAWLGYAHNWLGLVAVTPRRVRWNAVPVGELLRQHLATYIDGDVEPLVAALVGSLPATRDAAAAPLPESASQAWLVVLAPDDAGRYPVCAVEKEEAWVAFADLGDYLEATVVPDPKPAPRRARAAAGKGAGATRGALKHRRGTPRRSRLKRLESDAVAELTDAELVTYGVGLAELGRHLFELWRLTEVVDLLRERALGDGLHRVMRTHAECIREPYLSLLVPLAESGLRHGEHDLCERALKTFLRAVKRDPTDLYSQFKPLSLAMAQAAAVVGSADALLEAVERAVCFDGPTFAKCHPHPLYAPLWQRPSLQQRYPGECRRQLAAIGKKA